MYVQVVIRYIIYISVFSSSPFRHIMAFYGKTFLIVSFISCPCTDDHTNWADLYNSEPVSCVSPVVKYVIPCTWIGQHICRRTEEQLAKACNI